MAAITAAMVKELREVSGAGMMDCKKALTATGGDMDKAVDFLRENGQMKAQKKANRIAAEGLCMAALSDDARCAAVVEVNSETDFVAKNEKFRNYVADVAAEALATDAADATEFLAKSWKGTDGTVQDALTGMIAVIGENLKIRRFTKVCEPDGFVASYTHMGGKIVVLVDVVSDVISADVEEMARNIAMQAAAMRPQYCRRDEVDSAYIEKEKGIQLAAAKNEKPNAPEKVLNGIVMGRINKEMKEICLMDQIYVRAEDGKQSVQAYVDSVAKAAGAKLFIKGFVRYETGEGIEKKKEDFAAEVAAQIGK